FLTLNERALHEAPIDERLEALFQRGIDPSSLNDAARHSREDWPTRAEIEAFAAACDERVLNAIAHAKLEDEHVPRLVRGQAVYTIPEHEPMHHETLMYIIHRLDYSKKGRIAQEHHDTRVAANDIIAVDGGIATLGANRDEIAFGWDNEFERMEVPV